MSRPYRRVNRMPIVRAERAIRRAQREDAQKLKKVVIGRALNVPSSKEMNQELPSAIQKHAAFRSLGYQALIYVFRDELREQRGQTYYNSAQLQLAIQQVGKSAALPLLVGRGELKLHPTPMKHTEPGREMYWLSAQTGKAWHETDGRMAAHDIKQEELHLARILVDGSADKSAGLPLWLGAVSARSYEDAQELVVLLDDIIPTRMQAGELALLQPGQTLPEQLAAN